LFGEIDLTLKPLYPQFFLAKPNKTVISKLKDIYQHNLNKKLGNISELTFSMPLYIEDSNHQKIRNHNIDIIKQRLLIKATLGNKEEWFIINKIDSSAEDVDSKIITAFSLGFELSDKVIRGYKCTSYNIQEVLLGISDSRIPLDGDSTDGILNNSIWRIGYIDSQFLLTYRSFEFSSVTLLDCIFELAESFKALIVWDTINRTISFYKYENLEYNKGLKFSYNNYLKSINKEEDAKEMVSKLIVEGKDGLSINKVNPTGTNFIENFLFFLNGYRKDENNNVISHSQFMSDGLCEAIIVYQNLVISKKGEFDSLLEQLKTKQELYTVKDNELTVLEQQLEILKDSLDIALSNDQDTGQLLIDISNKEDDIEDKNAEIDIINDAIDDINIDISELRYLISIENNFTEEEIQERSLFIIEKEWIDQNYDNAEDLYTDALIKFEELSLPKTVINIDIVNFLEIVEEQKNWDKLNLGDIVTVTYEDLNIDVQAKIVEIEYDFEEGNISLVIANIKDILNVEEKFYKDIYSAISTSSTVNLNKSTWNSTVENKSEIGRVIDILQNNVKNEINMSVNESVEINKRGIRVFDLNDKLKYIVLQHGVIALTQDGGNSWKVAITPEKIVADLIMGRLVCGQQVQIDASDINGVKTFTVDQTGVKIYNMVFSLLRENKMTQILIDPSRGFLIQKNTGTVDVPVWKDVFIIDENGNLIAVDLTCQNFKLVNDNGGILLEINSDPSKNIIDFSSFTTKNGTIYADNLNINGMSIKDELGKVWTEINENGSLEVTASNDIKSITPDGIISSFIDCDYPNKYSNSGGENYDLVTLRPFYHSAGTVSFESAYDNTVSIMIPPSGIITQINEESTGSGLANTDWWGNRDTRFSFKFKGGTVGVNSLRISIMKFSDNTPLTIIDDSGEEEVSSTSIIYQGVSDWDIGSSKSFYFLSPLGTGYVYVKYENISANNIYIDQMMIKPKFGKYPGIFQSGPYSFPTSSFAIEEYQEYRNVEYSNTGIDVILRYKYLDVTVNGMPWTTSDIPSELNGQPVFFHGKFEKENIGGTDYYSKLILTPIGSNIPSNLTNGRIHIVMIGRGIKLT